MQKGVTMTHTSQASRILKLLQQYAPNAVPLPEILSLHVASYTRRLTELRRAGWIIETLDEWAGRERHTAYRLLGKLSDQVNPT
jgi:hypothetical protein